MASSRAGITAEGALYESVARGNKDTFFFQEDPEKTLNPFENRYEKTPPLIHELRRIPPLNGAEFGRSCEFEFEIAGDIFMQPTILIDLPTWIPPMEAEAGDARLIRDAAGNSYGYTNGIAYFLFSRIQIYQDKLLLEEYSGDALFARRAGRGSLSSAYLENTLTGWHDGSVTSIAANATPPRLRLEIPFIGGRQGFPSIAMRKQTFKLRLDLRKLEEIVESSDATTTEPARPWLLPIMQNGATSIKPLALTAIAAPTLQLESRHIYTDGETQVALRSKTIELPFSRIYENTSNFGVTDYAPLLKNVPAIVTRRLDAQHPASRVFWFIRSRQDLRAGRRWKFTGTGAQEYYANESLIIAGRDRETLFSPFIWNTLTHHAKEDRDCGAGIGEMSWDLGNIYGRRAPFYDKQPEGSVNFTTADRPTLYTSLADAAGSNTEMTAIVDTWVLYVIENNRGYLKYGN